MSLPSFVKNATITINRWLILVALLIESGLDQSHTTAPTTNIIESTLVENFLNEAYSQYGNYYFNVASIYNRIIHGMSFSRSLFDFKYQNANIVMCREKMNSVSVWNAESNLESMFYIVQDIFDCIKHYQIEENVIIVFLVNRIILDDVLSSIISVIIKSSSLG